MIYNLFYFIRIPQDILETECDCAYCLNEMRNYCNFLYRAYPIMVTRYFKLRGESGIFNAQFSMGCFCEYNRN